MGVGATKADMLDVYKAGFIDMKNQYLTVGVNGLTEAAEFLGLKISPNPEYGDFVNTVLETINIANRKDKTPDEIAKDKGYNRNAKSNSSSAPAAAEE